jgi:hypothetical protein
MPSSQSPAPIPETVTVCLTSCARMDLLRRTLASFAAFNPGGGLIVSEDSGDPAMRDAIASEFPSATLIWAPERLGQMRSIDRMFSRVTTPYLFHLEDDWLFDGAVDWAALIRLLETRSDVANIAVRDFEEIKPKYRARSDRTVIEGQVFQVMRTDAHPEFFGWSNGPGLQRTKTYFEYAPFAALRHDQVSARIKADGGREAFALPGVAHHIGQQRNVVDPTTPPRAKSKVGKYVRWAKKRLYYMGLRKDPY